MRYRDRFNVKRLFVLGAGASYSVTRSLREPNTQTLKQAPLDKTFLNTILCLDDKIPGWIKDSKAFVKDKFLDRTKDLKDFGLEEAIIRQLGQVEFIDAIHPRRRIALGADNIEDFQFNYLNHLSHLISIVLKKSRENSHKVHQKFVSKVFPKNIRIENQRDRIITFNYDNLIDKYLISRFQVNRVYFDRIKINKNDSNKRSSAKKFDNPFLIKIHGSINWRCSSDEFKKVVYGHDGDDVYEIKSIWVSDKTVSPDHDYSPVIMPPLPVKPITEIKLFQFLWTRAFEYLHEAEEIIVCGYSLPEMDRLALSLFGNFANKNLKQVTVVDPDPTIMTKWRNLLRRKNVNNKVKWSYFDDFEEYVGNMIASEPPK